MNADADRAALDPAIDEPGRIRVGVEEGVTTPAPALFCGPAELPDVIRALKR